MIQVTSIQFTVGKVDAGIAVLLSPDHHLIEFPANLLPDGLSTGSIVNVTVERNQEEEQRQKEEFAALQEDILSTYSQSPQAPVISVKAVTQTSVIIKWDPLVLYAATFRGLDVYRKGQKLNLPANALSTSAKLSGLDVAQEYDIWIVLRTSAGSFTSNKLQVKTHSMDNLTGLNPSFGSLSKDSDVDTLIELLDRIGAKYTDDLTSDNTHLVCTVPKGPKYERALELNIPIVTPEFLKACELQQKGLHLSMYKNTYESIDLFSNLNALVQVDHNPTTNTDPVHILLNQIISTVGSDKKPCIVIDDVSMLLYAGLSIEQLVKLVMALNGYVIEKSGCLVMLVHDDNPDDEEQVSLNSLLTLESGFTEDIHGQLTVKLGPQSLWEPPGEVAQSRVIRPGSILFRINDSSVEWFAKGTTVM
ncbi:hypothetical protein BDEG_21088 [Batrachochytrium dendrobatidis JEL423]|uniref:Fibronectin type-III domain-containing protein n=1 Tax=Batrachochytrium dendrobatidis (strain JEL423) TaxID=403673 RepID=A0A177WA80_BATDL|nr:hypothetical protein BDEG_21088 [Batrachochytrium dendrobatidis JEL423]